MRLMELFDGKYDYKWMRQGTSEWLGRFSASDGTTINVEMDNFNEDLVDSEWGIVFGRDGDMTMTGQGDQIKILSTVVAMIKDMIDQNNPLVVEFTAGSDDLSRTRLYQKMAERLSATSDYKLTTKPMHNKTKFVLKRTEMVSEAFNQPYELSDRDRKDDCTRYRFSDQNGQTFAVLFHDGGPPQYPIDVSFGSLRDETATARSYNFDLVRSKQNQIRVYSTVIKAIDNYIRDFDPDKLEFQSWNNSTANLYRKYAQHMAQKYDMEMSENDIGYFLLTKKPIDAE